MDLVERYDELDNIVSTLDVLIDEISDKDYIEELQEIKYRAMNEQDEVEIELQKEQDLEEQQMNQDFIQERIYYGS